MNRTQDGRPRARLAATPLATTARFLVDTNAPSFRPVLVSPPPSHSEIGGHTSDRLRAVDVWLDSLDAANELPDGSLPGRVTNRKRVAA